MSASYVLPIDTRDAALEMVGGKGRSLARMAKEGFPVPGGFYLTTRAYRRFVRENSLQADILDLAEPELIKTTVSFESASTAIRGLFGEAAFSTEIASEIREAYGKLRGNRPAVAVRSSANAEDLTDISFAGQQDTYLNVRGADPVLSAVRDCWASLWTERAISYRYQMGIDHGAVAMAVIVQVMVPSRVSGVLFTASPLTGERDEIVVNASFGLGEAVVGGRVTPDSYLISKESLAVKESIIGEKEQMAVPMGEQGTTWQPVPETQRKRPSLTASRLRELALLAVKAEALFGGQPLDIEWAVAGDTTWMLQARPITRLPPPPLKAVCWDPPFPEKLIRRGWAEHILGPVCPLFEDLYLNRGLERAYDKFEDRLRRLRLPRPRHTTINGYAYGRASPTTPVYLSPLGWKIYRIKLRIVLWLTYKLTWLPHWRFIGLPRYLSRIRKWGRMDPAAASDRRLYAGIQALTDADAEYWIHTSRIQGLSKVASIRMMGFLQANAAGSGLLRGNVNDKSPPSQSEVSTDILTGFPSRSHDAHVALAQIAGQVRENGRQRELVLITPVERLLETLRGDPDGEPLAGALGGYLDTYGHQAYTLDFVEPTQIETPSAVLSSLKSMVAGVGNPDPALALAESRRKRKDLARSGLRFFTGKLKRQFRWRLWIDGYNSRHRENAIYHMGAAWVVLRPFALELGRRLVDAGTLTTPDDVFYLTGHELLAAMAARTRGNTEQVSGPPGTVLGNADRAIPALGKTAVERRRLREARKYLQPPSAVPVEVLETHSALVTQKISGDDASDTINGFATNGGQVTAPASVILSPADFAKMKPGTILVCPLIAPAWTPLFTQAGGLVTDIGGLMGHGSIVAREYGIPAVMGTGTSTSRIKHGQTVTVDGDNGTVTIETG